MNADAAANKWKVTIQVVMYWIKIGRIPAKPIQKGGRTIWEIPDELPMPGMIYKNKQKRKEEEKRARRNINKRKYIAKYAGTYSTAYLARYLGISCDEVRAILVYILGWFEGRHGNA